VTRLELVKQWYQEKGSLDIPQDTVVDGVWIGKWIVMQKKYLELGKLSREQEAMLSALPLEQVSRQDKSQGAWLQMYQDAVDYAKTHGSLKKIPPEYCGKSGKQLNAWVRRQRAAREKGRLSKEQCQMLDMIGSTRKPGLASAEPVSSVAEPVNA